MPKSGAALLRASPPAVWLAIVASLAASAAGCRGRRDATADASPRHYTVRGEIVKLSPPQVLLRHEPIDDFVNAAGKVVGMDSMVMPFDVAPSASLEGIAPGDKVEVVFAVDWARPSMRIEGVKKLPPDTALRFGKAQPGAGAKR